jgi:hypothetical protein
MTIVILCDFQRMYRLSRFPFDAMLLLLLVLLLKREYMACAKGL